MILWASRGLPPRLADWAKAMERELAEIGDDGAALAYAGGCLRALLGLAIAARMNSLRAAARSLFLASTPSSWRSRIMNPNTARPRSIGLFCGAAAVAAGLAYMAAAGAPSRHLLVNLASLVLGATAWLALGRMAGSRLAATGPIVLALAVPLLLTAFFGIASEGASRWVKFGPLILQPGMILVPLMLILYARQSDAIGTGGMIAAAIALAVQPDRAMASALAAGLLARCLAKPARLPAASAIAAALAFGSTLMTPDRLPATAFVDRILYTAFDLHPLAGAALAIGASILLLPAADAARSGTGGRPVLLAFGACWLAILVAALFGNYPTPLVGYGGSAVLGYLLNVAFLPDGKLESGEASLPALGLEPASEADLHNSELRIPRLA
jgi:hypothetical protein